METQSRSLADIEEAMKQLQRERDALLQRERGPVIKRIKAEITQYSITRAELFGPDVAPKVAMYRNPATGQTYSGRGRKPDWLKQAKDQGKSEEDFLIKKTN